MIPNAGFDILKATTKLGKNSIIKRKENSINTPFFGLVSKNNFQILFMKYHSSLMMYLFTVYWI